jgi:hypothetical protein
VHLRVLCCAVLCSQVSLSHVVMPMVKMVPRGFTAAADAYLTPHILRWDTLLGVLGGSAVLAVSMQWYKH